MASATMSSKGPTTSTMDVVDVLMNDHRTADELIEKVEGATDKKDKRDFAQQLIKVLIEHSVAEEMFVYPVMAQKLTDGAAKVEQDKKWHQTFEETMVELEKHDSGDPAFDECLQRLKKNFHQHKKDEESDQFPELRQKLSGDELISLGDKVNKVKKTPLPTHPHPSAGHEAYQRFMLGPGLALADRLRDAVTTSSS